MGMEGLQAERPLDRNIDARAPVPLNDDGTAAIDWLARESADRSSRFHQKVETSRVAAMGMSSAAAGERIQYRPPRGGQQRLIGSFWSPWTAASTFIAIELAAPPSTWPQRSGRQRRFVRA